MSAERRDCVAHLYSRGTHYEVGCDVGRTYRSMIQEAVEIIPDLINCFIPLYNTPEGNKIYSETLEAVRSSFPQYVRELEGIAYGAQVDFYKLFLLHLDDVLPGVVERWKKKRESLTKEPIGCSTVSVNLENCQLIGHTEDAYEEYLTRYYFLSAHIVSDQPKGKHQVREERFTALCYAGNLPGYATGYNRHGLVYSINTLGASNVQSGKIPRTFICRALLAAENYEDALRILGDADVGCANGCSVNMTFLNPTESRKFYNIEMAPREVGHRGSLLDIKLIESGETYIHCNKYLRVPMEDVPERIASSINRIAALTSHGEPRTTEDVLKMLGDSSNEMYPVFRTRTPKDSSVTICTIIMDLIEKQMTLYSGNSAHTKPIAVIPFVLKNRAQ